MRQYAENDCLKMIKGLFKGREDVFAIRWEKGNRGGYMPAYRYDPYRYRLHKMKGGSFKSYKDKTYLPLSDQQLLKHLIGQQTIGIYPLLEDNTSWFIAADFDKDNWVEECRTLMEICVDHGLSAYLERSRSGKGGHVWLFFEKPYPALRSRKILVTLLEQAGILSKFDKHSSFDRLFPNQDFHSGKGLGNLIALPFQKSALESGNSCFINEQLVPYPDQWQFVSAIKRNSISQLDAIYNSFQVNESDIEPARIVPGNLQIRLNKSVCLNRSGLTSELIHFLREELNFANSDFIIKKKSGRSTWQTERYFRLIEETEQEIIIPRGFVGRLIRQCKLLHIDFEFHDERKKYDAIPFSSNFTLRSHQEIAIKATMRKDFGIISAPPGSGKTVIGLRIIADKLQPALIIVHRKHLLEQWVERIQAFLGIRKNEIGRIGQGKAKKGKSITVAMIQSLGKYLEKQGTDDLAHSFGTIIVDECHHIPAASFRNTISKLCPYYQYGLTATPFRKGNDDRMIFAHLGGIISDIKPQDIEEYKRARVVVRETSLDVPFDSKTDPFEVLSKVLVHDSARNNLIIKDVSGELNKGKKAVILTERKEHIDALEQLLKRRFEVVTLSGNDPNGKRKLKWEQLKSGNYQVLITTGQFFGEGSDLQSASCLFLVYPFSFKGKLIQYIGRVQRAEFNPVIYDYRDRKIEYLNRLFLKRNTFYRQLDKQETLFSDRPNAENPTNQAITFEKKVRIPIDQLDFRFGSVAFEYEVPGANAVIAFEIENENIRPEFEVLIPFFSKVFGSKFLEVNLFVEFEEGFVVSQTSSSEDVERINQETIEIVKFRFLEQNILGKQYSSDKRKSLLDLKELQDGQKGKLVFDSEEKVLNEILNKKKVIHYKQLRYLASRHDGKTLKIRFVLNPFSFVFLITGAEQYHIILETLDTKEATYVWHFEKNNTFLSKGIRSINQDLNYIRNMGRTNFLEKHPQNFSRLIHDYSDERKGFIQWKDLLEERLI